MAGTLAFKNEGDAKAWVAKANELNHEAKTLNQMVGQILKTIELDSEGDIVVKLIQAANSMLKFATQVMEVMENIANTISNVIDSIVENVTSVVGKIVNFITGG